MRTLILCMSLLMAVPAWASGVVKAYSASRHFGLESSTIMGMTAKGPPDERGWRQRTRQRLQSDADKLEGALPRMKDSVTAARALVPLDDPKGRRERIDLTGHRNYWLDVSFGAPVTAPEVDALVKAVSAELQIPRGTNEGAGVRRWVGTATFVVVVLSVLAGLWFGRRKVPAPRG